MRDCSRLDDFVDASSGELSQEEQSALLEHARSCPACQARLRDMARAAQLLSAYAARRPVAGPHATDMELAVLAAHGVEATDSEEAVMHLIACPICRQELAAIRLAIEQVEDLAGGSGPPRQTPRAGLRHSLRLACSTPARALSALLAGVCYAGMCVSLAAGLAHVALTYVLPGRGPGWALRWWPLSLIPGDATRLWVFVACSLAVGLSLRWLSRRLWGAAVRSAASDPETERV